jgi:adenylosuccinate synthase
VALRHTTRINGVDSIAVTKLDVLDEMESIEVCTHYLLDGVPCEQVPLDLAEMAHVKPVYQTVPGWQSDTTGITSFDKLPQKARDYLNFVAKDLGVKIRLVSTGARREETIMV